MSELESRTVILFLWTQGCLAKRIHEQLQAADGDAACALPSIDFWAKEFKCKREDIVDQRCHGRPPIDNLGADISIQKLFIQTLIP
jgi:hypothetical protein